MKWFLAIGSLIVCLIPTWILLAIYLISGPANFWQKFAVIGIGMILGGSIQVTLLFVWFLFVIWLAGQD